MSTIPPLSGPPLYRYIPGVGKVSAAVNGPTGPQGVQGTPGTSTLTGATGPAGTIGPLGNVLRVDAVNGNDTLANASSPYFSVPFLTITAALAKAASGQTVWVLPGTYNESITLPTGVSVRGMSTQTTLIQRTGVTGATTLVTMGVQTRLEDVTLNLTSSSNVDLIGVDFPTGTPQTAKMRTMVVNVTSTASGSSTVTGILSGGTSVTTISSAQAIRACTINVIVSGTGAKRGILVSGANRFSVRDTNVFVSGTSPDNVGVETTGASSIAELTSSSISGLSTSVDPTLHHDINRVNATSQIILAFTNLTNNDANGNSFSTVTEPSQIGFGVLGNLAADRTYYLVPGTVAVNDLPVDNNPTFTLAKAFQIPFNQPVVIFSLLVRFTGTITGAQTVAFQVHKNGSPTPSLSVTLVAGETTKTVTTQSVVFNTNDTFHTEVVTTGNVGAGTFFASVATY